MSCSSGTGGCCGGAAATPRGFGALRYGEVRARALSRLAQISVGDGAEARRALAGLSTRRQDDPSIAMIDAFAILCDVLAFYGNRIADEGYLPTATERRSVLELARAIGYELGPGVAASTLLAFRVETAKGSPTRAIVPAGTAVQSIPAQDELPQTFETMAEIEARVEWNEMPLRSERAQILGLRETSGSSGLYFYEFDGSLEGVDGAVEIAAPGATDTAWRDDEFLLTDDDTFLAMSASPWGVRATRIDALYFTGKSQLEVGDRLLLVGRSYEDAETQDAKRHFASLVQIVKGVDYDAAANRTRIVLGAGELPTYGLSFFALPIALVYSYSTSTPGIVSESGLQFLLAGGLFSLGSTPPPAPPVAADVGVFAFGESLAFYGHNAPNHNTLPTHNTTTTRGTDPYQNSWEGATIWTDSQGTARPSAAAPADVYLEREARAVAEGGWVVIENDGGDRLACRVKGTLTASLSDYAMSGKATGLLLQDVQGDDLTSADKSSDFKVRRSSAHVGSERLDLAALPIETDVGGDRVLLKGLIEGLTVGRQVIVTGEARDQLGETTSEVAEIAEILHVISRFENGAAVDGYTSLRFTAGLAHTYARESVRVRANVVLATHGATVQQTLGDGDGAQPRQRFALTGLPLTYVSSSDPSGRESSLVVRVNGIEWQQLDSLYGAAANATGYVVRHQDDGSTVVEFGDGAAGARLPSGSQNVVAGYRRGIGLDGEVAAGTLTLLARRPFGIRDVTNPLAASGAADVEELDAARANAPLRVLTFDRIVSMQDYEDFARGFPGIGKARADTFWKGEREVVHLTVASAAGDAVTGELYGNLVDAIAGAHDPSVEVHVSSYRRRLFEVEARLVLDPRHVAADVLAAAARAIAEAYSFAARDFGAPVVGAEVVTLLDGIDGVIAVDLETLRSDPDESTVLLPAASADSLEDGFVAAELLLVNPAGITLAEVRP